MILQSSNNVHQIPSKFTLKNKFKNVGEDYTWKMKGNKKHFKA